MTIRISREALASYRSQTFRWSPEHRLKTKSDAISYVNERGFIFFWPIRGLLLPSLWVAVAGNRPVADEHDDPGHITWDWKDSSLGKHDWYYARVLRRRATLIAMNIAPYFYALSENYGDPEEDYLTLYKQGRLSQESKIIYEVLLSEGMLDTLSLRRATHMTGKENETRFSKALAELQADFKIVPVAVTQAGSWHYAFVYGLVFRHYPAIIEQSRFITQRQAQRKLAELYLRSVGAATIHDLIKLFQWDSTHIEQIVQGLKKDNFCVIGEVDQSQDRWIIFYDLIEKGWTRTS